MGMRHTPKTPLPNWDAGLLWEAYARTFPRRPKPLTRAVERARLSRLRAYRCGTAPDFDRLPHLSRLKAPSPYIRLFAHRPMAESHPTIARRAASVNASIDRQEVAALEN